MDSLTEYREILKRILLEYTEIPFAHYQDLRTEAVFDSERDRYVLNHVGWDGDRHMHWNLVHVDIQDGQIWIQNDGTEDGIASELEAAGVPRNRIVLGFRPAEWRKHTGFAVGTAAPESTHGATAVGSPSG